MFLSPHMHPCPDIITGPWSLRPVVLILMTLALAHTVPATETVRLRSPLTTVAPGPRINGAIDQLSAHISVPAGAPEDLGVGAYLIDRHGVRFQVIHDGVLTGGEHRLHFDLSPQARLRGADHAGGWDAFIATRSHQAGLFFWSATTSNASITIHAIEAHGPEEASADPRILDLVLPSADADGHHAATGERWIMTCRPAPMPANPFDPDALLLRLDLVHDDGQTIRIEGFYRRPYTLHDGGDREIAQAAGDGHYEIRWRPRRPGRWRATLHSLRRDHPPQAHPLPDIMVGGEPWDGYVHIAEDSRFFVIGQGDDQRFFWPLGLNIRSVNDVRGSERTNARLTPDRGIHAYRAYIDRLVANGGNAIEIWMSSWNLALEWREDWPGYYGRQRYSQVNAQRLDALLDHCRARGVYVNLVIRNHGQGSHRTDREWHNNPWNRDIQQTRGVAVERGPIASSAEFFTDPVALAGQEQLHRYLIARYGDDPAILGWKFWSEMNLTGGSRESLRSWHAHHCARWRVIDPYQRPVTSHWSGNYRTPDHALIAVTGPSGIDYVCIDAYHGRRQDRDGILLAQLMWQGTLDPSGGLGRYNKPILVTEYGGNWNACPEPQLIAEHRSGPWAALMSGNAGAPMLWWFEWVDQNDHWQPYRALAAFLAGEDLRSRPGSTATPAKPAAQRASRNLWTQLWARPGRILGYILDERWGYNGLRDPTIEDAVITVGTAIGPGTMTVEWWHAETGDILNTHTWQHPGGALNISPPPFARHIAFKLWRHAEEGGES